MIQIEFSLRRDVMLPLFLIVVVLFMPFRLIQAIILFFVVARLVSLASALITARLPVAVRMDSVAYATARSKFAVRYEVINRSILPVGPVHVHDSAGNFATTRQPADLVVLSSGETQRLRYLASGQERGEHEIGPLTLSGSDSLGYYAWERRFDSPLRVIIYPAVHRVAYPELHGLPAGNLPVQSPLYEDPTQFRSLREYMPGDELKRVNWKASARMGTLYAMEYVPTIYFPVMIALNLTTGSYPVNERSIMAERAIETAASLIFFYVGLKQEVGLVTTGHVDNEQDADARPQGAGGTYSPSRPGHGHAVTLLEELARIKMSDTAGDVTVQLQRVPLPAGTRLLVVSPPLSEAQADRLVALKRRGYRLLCFIVGSRSTSREDLSVPGLNTIPVMGREDELVRE